MLKPVFPSLRYLHTNAVSNSEIEIFRASMNPFLVFWLSFATLQAIPKLSDLQLSGYFSRVCGSEIQTKHLELPCQPLNCKG